MSRNRRGALEEGHAHTKRQQVLPTPSLIEGRSRRGRAPAWGGRQRPASLCGRRNTRTLDRDRACERERDRESVRTHERARQFVRQKREWVCVELRDPDAYTLRSTPHALHSTHDAQQACGTSWHHTDRALHCNGSWPYGVFKEVTKWYTNKDHYQHKKKKALKRTLLE